MVIQSNMSSNAIVEVWPETKDVFDKYDIPLSKHSLEALVEQDLLSSLLQGLNSVVGSSTATCIDGG